MKGVSAWLPTAAYFLSAGASVPCAVFSVRWVRRKILHFGGEDGISVHLAKVGISLIATSATMFSTLNTAHRYFSYADHQFVTTGTLPALLRVYPAKMLAILHSTSFCCAAGAQDTYTSADSRYCGAQNFTLGAAAPLFPPHPISVGSSMFPAIPLPPFLQCPGVPLIP
ncbi:hypothetical protein HPB51_027904 [Rhipicephalus microplus]|uniref:Uncharacterized protein n=1 Tax=Rhipicephalus microplus TaxID=6941 RepID=A0A9J6CYK2_RHIMP|nr:hypothetical protein HPB51_027904 [Rhipicephalus microplus]